ncbi:MAG: protease family protein [Verrucomicrobiota bacterium]
MQIEKRITDASVRKSAWILASIALLEGSWVILEFQINGWRFVRYLGFANGAAGTFLGWIAAAVVVVIFVGFAMRLPSVRANLFRPSGLKVLALFVAVTSGILEEVMFRRWPMNYLQEHGHGVVLQVLGSGLLFGALHGVWGLMGRSVRAAIGATLATGFLGAMLAVVFILAGRSLAPCVAAHFLINVFIEPGLVLAVTRGEMSRLHK